MSENSKITAFDGESLRTLFLASQSPRRAQLLRQIGIPFALVDSEIDEQARADERPIDYVSRMAKEKVAAGYQVLEQRGKQNFVVLAADTIVVADGGAAVEPGGKVADPSLAVTPGTALLTTLGTAILGKPKDQGDAESMLMMLSAKSHFVVTAFAVMSHSNSLSAEAQRNLKVGLTQTRVSFASVSRAQAEWYWATGEPLGKAGGYAIQGLGAVFIDAIEGSYSGVVGLPLYETSILLREFGIVPKC